MGFFNVLDFFLSPSAEKVKVSIFDYDSVRNKHDARELLPLGFFLHAGFH